MELYDCTLSSLFCPEDGSHLGEDEEKDEIDELFVFGNASPLTQAEDDFMETLLSKDTNFATSTLSFFSSEDRLSVSDDSRRFSRLESIRWILKMKFCCGFKSQTAYLAMSYLDSFFLRRVIHDGNVWAMKLLTIACLSLAAKMEESSPPLLSEYRLEDYRFSSKLIQRMELLVLDTLEWRLSCVTPFAFLSYFASKFQFHRCYNDLIPPAIGFIFQIAQAMSLMSYRPSTIAASAIFAASGDGLIKKFLESKISGARLSEPLDMDQIFSCYEVMIQETRKDKINSKIFGVHESENHTKLENSVDFIHMSPFSVSCNKRRRLQWSQLG
ncbi:hypothetical protein HPP92_007543 [Vanilla planifolia]|uniref:Uncharacterized protein n=1 Tax=Vanilla planifolia TaxID=51239 RepID=A0A835RM04_VANPL|nr:hypothetical protein HPP92_007543 [Vanilla planifolia]